MAFDVVNFRLPTRKRQALRIALLQEGQTLQSFFVSVVEEKLGTSCGMAQRNGKGKQELTGHQERELVKLEPVLAGNEEKQGA